MIIKSNTPLFSTVNQKKERGFTIIELLVVIVVIGVLAAITIVAFNSVQSRAKYAREQSDMNSLNKLIQVYYSSNSAYPSTGGSGAWSGWLQAPNFIPGIVPTHASSIPQMPSDPATQNSYLYTSNGTDYKLIRYSPATGLPAIERINNTLADPARNVNAGGGAWGYWSSGASAW